VIFIELIFVYPGIGKMLNDSVGQHDFPLMQACFLIITAAVIVSNILADLLYAVIDPGFERRSKRYGSHTFRGTTGTNQQGTGPDAQRTGAARAVLWAIAWSVLRRRPSGLLGLLIILVFTVLAIIGPYLYPPSAR
jgi:hypothetical protein